MIWMNLSVCIKSGVREDEESKKSNWKRGKRGKRKGKEEVQNKLVASLESTLIDILIRNQISLP